MASARVLSELKRLGKVLRECPVTFGPNSLHEALVGKDKASVVVEVVW